MPCLCGSDALRPDVGLIAGLRSDEVRGWQSLISLPSRGGPISLPLVFSILPSLARNVRVRWTRIYYCVWAVAVLVQVLYVAVSV